MHSRHCWVTYFSWHGCPESIEVQDFILQSKMSQQWVKMWQKRNTDKNCLGFRKITTINMGLITGIYIITVGLIQQQSQSINFRYLNNSGELVISLIVDYHYRDQLFHSKIMAADVTVSWSGPLLWHVIPVRLFRCLCYPFSTSVASAFFFFKQIKALSSLLRTPARVSSY